MKSLQDALYNWLTIKVVSDERPEDGPAKETTAFFAEILTDEFGVKVQTVKKDERMYTIEFLRDGNLQQSKFPIDLIDVMLNQIKREPEKFKNYLDE
jgi:hypothetical protein